MRIPPMPDIALKVKRAIDEDAPFESIAKLIELDVALSARLIQVSNSAIFNTLTKVTAISQALAKLGTSTVLNLVYAFCLKDTLSTDKPIYNSLIRAHWAKSIQLVAVSSLLNEVPKYRDVIFLAALLDNLGDFIIIADAADNNVPIETIDFTTSNEVKLAVFKEWDLTTDLMKDFPSITKAKEYISNKETYLDKEINEYKKELLSILL